MADLNQSVRILVFPYECLSWGWAARAISFERLLFFPPAKIKRARGHGEYKKSDLITTDTHYKKAGRRCRWNEKGKVSQEMFPMRKFIRRINI